MAALYLRGSAEEYLVIPESHLPLTYDPAAISAVWRQHPRCALARLGEIGRHMLPFMAGVCAEEVGVRLSAAVRSASASSELGDVVAAARSERQARRAAELRELFTRLGPTFVKCGQMLSIRPDLLPPAAIYELQKLCDAVPSYPTADAMALVAAELGRPVGDVFDDLDESSVPIAAASLGQVYRCRLRRTGELVALKVQRPDMIRAVSLDLYLLRRYMQAVEWFKQEVRGKGVHGRSAGRGRGGCMGWGEGPWSCLEVAWRQNLRRHAAMGEHPWLSRGQRRGMLRRPWLAERSLLSPLPLQPRRGLLALCLPVLMPEPQALAPLAPRPTHPACSPPRRFSLTSSARRNGRRLTWRCLIPSRAPHT